MSEALNLYRRVVDCLTSGQQIDKQELAETNLALATALDRAKVYNLPTDDLEAARDAVLHLYEVL
jgi:transcriptional/translational regulatory protein YebC/TACO1